MWKLLRLLAGRPDFKSQIKSRSMVKDLVILRCRSSQFDIERPDQWKAEG